MSEYKFRCPSPTCGVSITVETPDDLAEAEATGDLAEAYGDDSDPDCWPVSANAALIAAAPDLLAALRTALGSVDGSGTVGHKAAAEVIRAAIAKAECRS